MASSSEFIKNELNDSPSHSKEAPASQSPEQDRNGTNKNRKPGTSEQKRPMNAFLLFCKSQRSAVREKYPNLENRGITRILGDSWSKLDQKQKSEYTDLAKQHKVAFMKANPDFRWCKTITTSSTSNKDDNNNIGTKEPKVANSTVSTDRGFQSPVIQDNALSNFRSEMTNSRQQEAPKPPKKRFLERNDLHHSKASLSHPEVDSYKVEAVPSISIDQETLDRVIEEAYSDMSSSTTTSSEIFRASESAATGSNLTSRQMMGSLSNSPLIAAVAPPAVSVQQLASPLDDNEQSDEPVDFSMNRTFNATRQQIINNLVEKMLSQPSDPPRDGSRSTNVDSSKCQLGLPVVR